MSYNACTRRNTIMKKRLAMITAAMMAVAALSAPAVFAGETEAASGSTSEDPVEFSYMDVDDSIFDCQWWDTGLGFDICVPADWVDADLTQEMVDAGVIHIYGEDGGGANCTITCTELPAEVADTYDIDQLGADLAATCTSAMFADLSGIPAVVYENDEAHVSGFGFLSDDGYLIQGVISAPSDDEYEEYGPSILNIITSISPSMEQPSTETEA